MGRRFNSNAGWAAVMAVVGLAFGVVMTINVDPATRHWGWGVVVVMGVLALFYGRRFFRGQVFRIDRSRQVIEIERPGGRVVRTIPFSQVDGVQLVFTTGAAGRGVHSRWTFLAVRHEGKTENMLRSFVSSRSSETPDDHETVRALQPVGRIVAEWIGVELLPVETEIA